MLPEICPTDMEDEEISTLLKSSPAKIQVLIDNLNTEADRFDMHFTHAMCKVLLQDWSLFNPNLVLVGKPIEGYMHLGSFITANGFVENEFSMRKAKARMALSKVQYLRFRRDGSMSVMSSVYC